ncbi:hypothetical protein COP1_034842 [Malus domestica]
MLIEKSNDGWWYCRFEERTQDLMRGAHVTFKMYGFDRTSINNLLALVTFLGKLGDEGGHWRCDTREIFWVRGFKDEALEGVDSLESDGKNFKEFESVKYK